MTLTEGRNSVRDMLREPSAISFSDDQINSWLNQAAVDASAKSLCCRENTAIYIPVNDISDLVNRLDDVALSGAPRICITQSHYFKVYPGKAGSETPAADPAAWRTYDDATLSGTPVRLGFAYGGVHYGFTGYALAAATTGATGDAVQSLPLDVPDDAITGPPAVFRIFSDESTPYYFKAYELADFEIDSLLAGCTFSDTLLTVPLPADTLKLISVHRTNDGGFPQGLTRIHPRIMGHLQNATTGDPRFFYEFSSELGLAPGGGATGITLGLHRALLVNEFIDLPDDLQPSAILYASMLGSYKALKFETGAAFYQAYLQNVFQIRRWIYGMDADDKTEFMIADRKEVVR